MHSRKAKGFFSVIVIFVVLVSAFAFLPKNTYDAGPGASSTPQASGSPTASPSSSATSTVPSSTSNPGPIRPDVTAPPVIHKNPGIIESATVVNSTVWLAVANQAWKYFEPDMGVVAETGLPKAAVNWGYFTDWDLGVYIQAVLDAERLNLISKTGPWGADDRLSKVLVFLETRNLTSDGLPYWWYDSNTKDPWVDYSYSAQQNGNVADAGQLLVALKNYESYADTSVKTRIENVVLNRTNYKSVIPALSGEGGSNNIYGYYVVSGFACFWPSISHVADEILTSVLAGTKTVVNKDGGNVTLPASKLSCEPLLSSIFDLQKADSRLVDLTHKVYLAHEEYYNISGAYRAFSEGPSLSSVFAYEWVILPSGQTWVVLDENNQPYDINPIIYTKAAFSFLALYNTTYAKNMCSMLEANTPDPVDGYYDGCNSDFTAVPSLGSNTNGLILAAARYAVTRP